MEWFYIYPLNAWMLVELHSTESQGKEAKKHLLQDVLDTKLHEKKENECSTAHVHDWIIKDRTDQIIDMAEKPFASPTPKLKAEKLLHTFWWHDIHPLDFLNRISGALHFNCSTTCKTQRHKHHQYLFCLSWPVSWRPVPLFLDWSK